MAAMLVSLPLPATVPTRPVASFFVVTPTPPTEIYTLSLHDALPIYLNLLKRARKAPRGGWRRAVHKVSRGVINPGESAADIVHRSEEHTSELQSRENLVCRLLLEKKKLAATPPPPSPPTAMAARCVT